MRGPVMSHDPCAQGGVQAPRPWASGSNNIIWQILLAWVVSLAAGMYANADEAKIQTTFPVKYVTADSVYLEGGSNVGLTQGQKLTVQRRSPDGGQAELKVIGKIEIEAVASVSAVGKIVSSDSQIVAGDVACLSPEDVAKLKAAQSSEDAAKYPQVASFTSGDPPDQETRDSLPRPPSPEVNHIRGRIGFDYSNLSSPSSGIGSLQYGYTIRVEATRLGGTFWSISGFQRGRVYSQNDTLQQSTLRDLINRTYHLSLSYNNPESRWVAGIGRLYVPWASSLSTLDGFYLGRRHGIATIGLFGGTTPDPTSWNYNRHRQMAGTFVNFAGGSFDSWRYSTTSGFAVSRISWHPDRQFGFFENGIFYKHYLSVYSDIETDFRNASQNAGQSGFTFSRSYLTVRLQPHKIISFDVSENYFRNIPTFDPQLIGTGLLDQFLFQGVSGGVRLELPFRVGLYSNLGRSSRSGDTKTSWNYLYGATVGNIFRTGVRADVRYSKFDSSFGQGNYRSLLVSREIGEGFRFDLQAGQEEVISTVTSQTRARFLNGNAEWLLRGRYVLGLGITAYRGQVQDYNQYYISLGYRFDFHHVIRAQSIH